jgi:hypothetical protein
MNMYSGVEVYLTLCPLYPSPENGFKVSTGQEAGWIPYAV